MSHLATAPDPAPAKPQDERAIYVQGLRDLAGFLEQHPDVPVDDHDQIGPWLIYGHNVTPQRAVELADALDGTVAIDSAYVRIRRAFGPITYVLTLNSRDVCEEREELAKVTVLPDGLRRRQTAPEAA